MGARKLKVGKVTGSLCGRLATLSQQGITPEYPTHHTVLGLGLGLGLVLGLGLGLGLVLGL